MNFPLNAKTIHLEAHSGTSGTMLSAVNYDRTVLFGQINCDVNNDNHIRIGSSGNSYILDTESNNNTTIWTTQTIASGTRVDWVKNTSADRCNFHLVYTDYLLASSTESFSCTNCGYSTATSTSATSSPITMNKSQNVEDITYFATTTQISPSQQQTVASYYIPNFLFIYFALLVGAIYGVILYAKKK